MFAANGRWKLLVPQTSETEVGDWEAPVKWSWRAGRYLPKR